VLTSGSYGAPGSTYATEVDSYSKITAINGSKGRPYKFKVERKDGVIEEYDYRYYIEDGYESSPGALIWRLTSQTDAAGNKITYINTVTGVSFIRWAYGGSSQPAAYLKFNYAPRPDKIKKYISGYYDRIDRRLASIESVNDGVVARKYKLTYLDEEEENPDNKSRLSRIEACYHFDGIVCPQYTRFEWVYGNSASFAGDMNAPVLDHGHVGYDGYAIGDINGDGIMDLAYVLKGEGKVKYALGGSIVNGNINQYHLTETDYEDGGQIPINTPTETPYYMSLFDYNGDGRQDLIVNSSGPSRVYLSRPQADGSWKLSSQYVVEGQWNGQSHSFVDVNGDGLQDVVTLWYNAGRRKGVRYLQKKHSASIDTPYEYSEKYPIVIEAPPEILICEDEGYRIRRENGDFNGDGRLDFILFVEICDGSDRRYEYHLFTSHEASGGNSLLLKHFAQLSPIHTSANGTWGVSAEGNIQVVDINNDGLSDVVLGFSQRMCSLNDTQRDTSWCYHRNEGGQISGKGIAGWFKKFRISNGATLLPEQSISAAVGDATSFADFNGDGFADVITSEGNQAKIVYWDDAAGNFSGAEVIKAIPWQNSSVDNVIYRDLNSDGKVDVMVVGKFYGSGARIYAGTRRNGQYPENKIYQVVDNFQNNIRITYESILNTDHYTYVRGVKSSVNESVCEDATCWSRTKYAASASNFYREISTPFLSLSSSNQKLDNQSLDIEPINPVYITKSPMYVATQVQVFGGGRPSARKTSYYYEQARHQAAGRGFLGFKSFTKIDSETGIRTTRELRQDWPFSGRVLRERSFTPQNRLLQSVQNIWGFADCYSLQNELVLRVAGCVDVKNTLAADEGTASLGALKPYLYLSSRSTYSLKTNPAGLGIGLGRYESVYAQDAKGNRIFSRSKAWDYGGNGSLLLDKKKFDDYSYSGPTYSMQMGRKKSSSVKFVNDLGETVSKDYAYSYYQNGQVDGFLKSVTLDPYSSEGGLVTTFAYDNYGNKLGSESEANGEVRNGEELSFSDGRYLYRRKLSLDGSIISSETVTQRNALHGGPERIRRNNGRVGVTENLAYSNFGVPFFSGDDTGAYSESRVVKYNSRYHTDCPSNSYRYITSNGAGGVESFSCENYLGLNLRQGVKSIDGKWMITDAEYDLLGRMLRVSEPYYLGANPSHWTDYEYDLLGRVTRIDHPYLNPDSGSRAFTTIEYNAVLTITTNPKGQVKKVRKNALGQVVISFDANSVETRFTYEPQGNLETITDAEGNVIRFEYDKHGRRTAMHDPDSGSWEYKYNAFGELVCQVNAKGQRIVQKYDSVGRLAARKEYSSSGDCQSESGTLESDVEYSYNPESTSFSSTSLIRDKISGFEKFISLDRFGRVGDISWRVPGQNSQIEAFYEKINYDQYGRVFQVFDASRNIANFQYNGVQYSYKNGYLESISDAVHLNGKPRSVYYDVVDMDVRGNVSGAIYGDSVAQIKQYDPASGLLSNATTDSPAEGIIQDLTLEWDAVGNLESRHEKGKADRSSRRDLFESFEYDSLNRLTDYKISGDATGNYSVDYDQLGNISRRTRPGEAANDYYYGDQCAVGAGPHAVCEIYRNGQRVSSYGYDANGSQVSGAGRSIDYTVFNKPKSITAGSHSTDFFYGPDYARYKRVDKQAGKTTTTLYIGNVEKIYHWDGTIQVKRNIDGKALVTQNLDASGNILKEETNYLHGDHLGSVNLLTDSSGKVIQASEFDPWGARRYTSNWREMSEQGRVGEFGIFSKPEYGRGFTGHEHLEETGLIHMNGRIYDPMLARFVQADPIIHDPFNLQHLNRYSYVWNNPLNAIDPSGFDGESCSGEPEERDCTEKDKPANGTWAYYKPASYRETKMSYVVTTGSNGESGSISLGGTPSGGSSFGSDSTVSNGISANSYGNNSGNASDGFFSGLGKGIFDGLGSSAWDAPLQNPFVDPLPGEDFTLGGAFGVNYQPPFNAPQSNEALLGYDLAPAVMIAVGLISRSPSGITKGAGRVIKCFPSGTLVLMADGTTKPIEEVEVGDEVFAMDVENDGEIVARLVTDTHQNKTMRLFIVQFDIDQDGISDGEFKATGEHPIWTSNAGWLDTKDLAIGDVLLTDRKEPVEVLSVLIEEGFSQTHNLSVDDIHTFFIVSDDTPILVHNTPRIHGVAPDWAVKGAHVTTSNGIELSIRGGGSGISIKPVFSADANSSKLNAAIAETKAALNDPRWRETLLDRTRKATEMLGQGSALDRAGSGGTRALEVALEKWCK